MPGRRIVEPKLSLGLRSYERWLEIAVGRAVHKLKFCVKVMLCRQAAASQSDSGLQHIETGNFCPGLGDCVVQERSWIPKEWILNSTCVSDYDYYIGLNIGYRPRTSLFRRFRKSIKQTGPPRC